MDNVTHREVDEEILSTYIAEAKEEIDRLVSILLRIEEDPGKQSQFIDELFRLAHNLKGSSGLAGLNEVKEILHEVENLFDAVRNGDYQLTQSDADLLLSLTDDLISYLDQTALNSPFPKDLWSERINRPLNGLNPHHTPDTKERRIDPPLILSYEDKKTVATWQEAGKQVYGIELHFTNNALLRSVTALVFIKYLKGYGEILTTAPDYAELEKEEFSCLKLVLLRETPLTTEEEVKISNYPVNDGADGVSIRQWQYRQEESENILSGKLGTQTIRVESERIDIILNQLGKILTLKTRLLHLYKQKSQVPADWKEYGQLLQDLDENISALQTSVMDLRMIPIRQIFSRFPKIVRDLAKKNGKKIELHFIGEETEIDKQVAEELIDPLTHLLHNSIAHGIEKMEDRPKNGKEIIGHITLEAHQDHGQLVIKVKDDGQGLDLERIKRKAIKTGIIKDGQNYFMEELTRLIFEPGFSTTDKVSEISGRGVGLDVVKNAVKSMCGEIQVKSQPNVGTEFILRVPLTFTMIQAFMVKIGGQVFGIPLNNLVQSIMINQADIHCIDQRMIYYHYPETIPLIDLAAKFKLEGRKNKDVIPVVVVNYGRGRVGFIVEELLGVEELMIKPTNKSLGGIREVSGAALFGNGNIAHILDDQALAQTAINL